MTKLFELSADWDEWVASRPPVIQAMCAKLPPNKLYRMKSTGHRVTLVSYSEDETVTVAVTGQFNSVVMDRKVFGIAVDDLEDCELPTPDEITGTVLTDAEDIADFINVRRIENGLPPLGQDTASGDQS